VSPEPVSGAAVMSLLVLEGSKLPSPEVEDLLRTVKMLREEVIDMKARLLVSEKDKNTLREEVTFLEKLREQEQSNTSGTGGVDGSVVVAAEETPLSAAKKILAGDLVSKEELEKVRREMSEQETLIKGVNIVLLKFNFQHGKVIVADNIESLSSTKLRTKNSLSKPNFFANNSKKPKPALRSASKHCNVKLPPLNPNYHNTPAVSPA
jgi:hypothetical protein